VPQEKKWGLTVSKFLDLGLIENFDYETTICPFGKIIERA
jgi:hypothetical protein